MSRIEFNLMPDVKMGRVKEARTRNLVVSLSILISGVALGLFILLFFTVNVVQRKQLNDANNAITAANEQLRGITGIEQILTVQNQLGTLTGLHQSKHVNTRLFTYLPQVTPTNISITNLTMDLPNSLMQISGTAPTHHAVNTFIDTLKFTTYNPGDGSAKNAFPTVVESDFAITSTRVSYTLDVHFEPVLFSNSGQAPKLNVPSLTTTRSVVENPSQLFTGQPPNTNRNQRQ